MALPPKRPFKKPVPKKVEKEEEEAPPAVCVKCEAEMEAGAAFCGECGTPVKAKMRPKRSMGEVRRNMEKQRNTRTIQGGRNTMLWLAILHLAAGVVIYLMYKKQMESLLSLPFDDEDFRSAMSVKGISARELDQSLWAARHWGAICFISFALPGFILLGLYGWARTNPLPATIAGLVTYLTFLVAGFALDPSALLSPVGWMIRLAIIGALTSAIRSASTERRIQERMRKKKERERRERAEQEEDYDVEEDDGATEELA